MAVLEKIRKRSAILFIVIIGALLAFILGDFLNSGRSLFGPGDTVAQVGNVKVKQNELAQYSETVRPQIEAQIAQLQSQGRHVPAELLDGDATYAQSIDNLLFQKLLEEECEKMGIDISDEFLTNYIYSPAAQEFVYGRLFNDPQTYRQFASMGIADPAAYLDAIKNPSRYKINEDLANQLSLNWKAMENDIDAELRTRLYSMAISGLFMPNKADAKVDFDNKNTRATVDFVSVPYTSVNDTEAKLEDADYKAVYDRYKGAYRLKDETREVAYIVVPIQASAKDYQVAADELATLKAELTTTDGMTAVNKFKGFSTPLTQKVTQVQLAYVFGNDSTGNAIGSVKQVDPYTLAKIIGTEVGVGDVAFDILPLDSEAQLDTIFTDKTPSAVDSVIKVRTQGQFADPRSSIVNPGNGPADALFQNENFKKFMENAPINEVVAFSDSINGQLQSFAVLVKERSTPETFYEVATVNKKVYPSNETRQEIMQKLQSYVASNGTAQSFADGKDYTVNYSLINPSSYTIANSTSTPETRTIVKWAMNADKGEVSPVFTKQKTMVGPEGKFSEDYLIAVAVMDVYDDEYVPETSNVVKDQLRIFAANDKKADIITKKHKDKNLAEYAKSMGTNPQQMTVTFGAGTLGREAQGAVAAAKKGAFVGPVKGNTGVYVFEVKDIVTDGKFEDKDLKTRLGEVRSISPVNIQNPDLFIGNRSKTNNMLIFTADETQE